MLKSILSAKCEANQKLHCKSLCASRKFNGKKAKKFYCSCIFKPGALQPARAWFLEITFPAQVYACVFAYAPEAINN